MSKQISIIGAFPVSNEPNGQNGERAINLLNQYDLVLRERDKTLYWLQLPCKTAFISKPFFWNRWEDRKDLFNMLKIGTMTSKSEVKINVPNHNYIIQFY